MISLKDNLEVFGGRKPAFQIANPTTKVFQRHSDSVHFRKTAPPRDTLGGSAVSTYILGGGLTIPPIIWLGTTVSPITQVLVTVPPKLRAKCDPQECWRTKRVRRVGFISMM